MEDETTEMIMNEMKDMITSKTDCMIESYGKVFVKTKEMFKKSLDNGDTLMTQDEIAKRSDMFWNIALQRIEKEQAEAKANLEREIQQQSMNMQRSMNPVQNMPQAYQGSESPCAKKARESAEKIAVLEAKVIESKEEK